MKKYVVLTDNPNDIPGQPTEHNSPCRPDKNLIVSNMESGKSSEFGANSWGSNSHGGKAAGGLGHGGQG